MDILTQLRSVQERRSGTLREYLGAAAVFAANIFICIYHSIVTADNNKNA